MHKNFIDFLNQSSFKTVLEIGCGTGYYPIKLYDLFKDISLNVLAKSGFFKTLCFFFG